MSSRKGDCRRNRPQRHQNSTSFKNDLHDNSTRIKNLNALSINEVCQRCHDVIEWKIKYRKYKALSQPKACNNCNERKVKKAYHVICRDCAIANKQCAKCLKSESEVSIIPPQPEPHEKLRLDVEMKQMIKLLPERKRRTFMRFMRGKKKSKDQDNEEDEIKTQQDEPVTRTRDELLEKIEKLKGADEEFYDGIAENDLDESLDESWNSEDFSSEEEG